VVETRQPPVFSSVSASWTLLELVAAAELDLASGL
jgi:hypothetical protein